MIGRLGTSLFKHRRQHGLSVVGTAISCFSTEVSNDEKIGFIGLGNMGLPMCLNLAAIAKSTSLPQITAFDLNSKSLQRAVDMSEGNKIVPVQSLEEMARSDCSIILTSLPSCDAVDHVMGTLLQNSSPKDIANRIFVDCSTVSPSVSRRWYQETKAVSQDWDFMDAPVSGGVKGAENATLTFMVGCDEGSKSLNRIMHSCLDKMGQRAIPCGAAGAGSVVKLCNNLALATQMVGICEAMNLGEALDVDPTILANVMNSSTAKCWSCDVNNPHPIVAQEKQSPASNNYDGGFASNLMLKDLGLAIDAAQNANEALPVGTATQELYRMISKHGWGEKDFGVMLQFLRGGGK
mmetsp:Transcript_13877/g.21628  ORF Transcript_13877/g.21628 Transcript_13877/m.21628 type:complete len:350 (+) Transcript_13877:119-1168(+)|eukprot:CAMPEP_0195307438 /NCGR_PEP_ID=MMETSP0707-20130614/37714_1 /TAXON_ID=33640 /ORGANISM="Asterionellopsis glacialis, Strain CCMP134" /LENGTH=349 /DNA_ID=CAMNT_0040371689 /DNA_START=96 /DNA_END=1145 /DNA_ORIENTATION=-